MKEKLLLFIFFLLAVALLLTAAACYSFFAVYLLKFFDSAACLLIPLAVAVTGMSFAVYLLLERIALKCTGVSRTVFALVTLLFPFILFSAAVICSRIIGIAPVTFSGGTALSLTLMLIICVRYLLGLSSKKTK